jgi:membrane protein
MKLFGRTAMKVFANPGSFALAVVKQFRANQGILLAGAVAYYTLLSLIPLLILILMALSHIVPENRLLLTLAEYLEFVVPGQSTALVDEVRKFLEHKEVVGASCWPPCCSSAPWPSQFSRMRCR